MNSSAITLLFLIVTMSAGVLSLPVAAPSQRLLTFLSVMSGRYSNIDEVKGDIEHHLKPHDVLNLTFKPVRVPATEPAPTIFFEEADNGRVYRIHLLVISEAMDGLIHVTPYNITDISTLTPGSYDLKDLQNLRPEDLHTSPECESIFMEITPMVFMGNWVDCRSYLAPGLPSGYVDVWTCDAVAGVVPLTSEEASNSLPYAMYKFGDSFPLLPYMLDGAEDFKNPCSE